MLLYILEENTSRQREVNGWAGSRCWCLASLVWPFGKWRWDCWVVNRSTRTQKQPLGLPELLPAHRMAPPQYTTPTSIYVQNRDSMNKVFPSSPNTVVHLDTAGRLQAKWSWHRNPQKDALGFSMYRIINLRIRERTLCTDDIKYPCQDHDVHSLAADLESEICPWHTTQANVKAILLTAWIK